MNEQLNGERGARASARVKAFVGALYLIDL